MLRIDHAEFKSLRKPHYCEPDWHCRRVCRGGALTWMKLWLWPSSVYGVSQAGQRNARRCTEVKWFTADALTSNRHRYKHLWPSLNVPYTGIQHSRLFWRNWVWRVNILTFRVDANVLYHSASVIAKIENWDASLNAYLKKFKVSPT